jgi:hypothetical protein
MTPAAFALLSFLGIPTGYTGDSVAECRAAAQAWQEDFRYVTEVDAYASMGEGMQHALVFGVAGFAPAVGLELQRGSDLPAVSLAWSATLPVGPVTACRSSRHSHDLYTLQPLRLVAEGGVVIRSHPWPYLRPGVRAIWHRSAWPLGVGAGLGSTLAVMPGRRGAASISPELLLHTGKCCAPGYWLLTLRADFFYPRSEPTAAVASLTFAFW